MGASGKWLDAAQFPCSGGCWWTGTTGVAFLGGPQESSLSVVTQQPMLLAGRTTISVLSAGWWKYCSEIAPLCCTGIHQRK